MENEPVVDDMKSDLAAAMETLEAGETNTTPAPSIEGQAPATPEVGAKPTPAPETVAAPAVAGKPAAAPVVAEPEVKPPQSWKPDMRERWKTLPKEVQQEVLRREREINNGLQASTEARRFQEEFNKVAQPFAGHIAAVNGSPIKAFGDYLRTSALLRTGSPGEKANAIAAAIQEYGVPVELLDTALAARLRGQPMPQTQGQSRPQEFRDPRVDQILQGQEQAEREAMSAELESFSNDPKNEFFADVKSDMADLLEFNAQRGVKMTLQQAYDRCCRLNDSVQATVDQRKTSTLAARQAKTIAQARHAASSVPGSSAAAAAAPSKTGSSMRDDLENAVQQLEG